jgi:hypothetical protein
MKKDGYDYIHQILVKDNSDESSSCGDDTTVNPKKDIYKHLTMSPLLYPKDV